MLSKGEAMSTLNYSVEIMTEEKLFELGRALATYLINNGILKNNQDLKTELESLGHKELLEE
ncbi:MAG: hypothetical protein FD179_1180 [Erysipelotrichaceae bacterium]|nr:MAG: hypothetical protein FD179_1180 [Erysipelotrichaceae bacterium]